ncbi:MAG: methionine transporter ATP-binding protein [Herbaspirillum sp.]|nr:methionine transporter ATP-binding protein [Herbaspirillum sp.]
MNENRTMHGDHGNSSDPAIVLENIRFSWPGQTAATLQLADFSVGRQDQVFMSGPSGSGKSTLLALIGGIVLPQTGRVHLLGQDMRALSASGRDRFRVDHIGFIFQQFNLIPYLSMLDNVLLPCQFSAYRRQRALKQGHTLRAAAAALLGSLDLAPTLWDRPATQLSIGQQQRVAAARALIGRPEIIVADEPTSALDADRQQGFLDLMQRECAQAEASLLFVSHDQRLAQRFTHRVALDAINTAPVHTEDEGAAV